MTPPAGNQSDEHPSPGNPETAASPDGSVSDLLPTDLSGLSRIQAAFDRYQHAAFGDRPPAFFALELCGEAGELANLEKKLWRGSLSADDAAEDLREEAADVVISILNYANARGVDLAAAVAEKLRTIDERRMTGRMGPAKGLP